MTLGRRVHKSDCISSLRIPMRRGELEERYAPRDLYTSKERKGDRFFCALAIPSTRRDVKRPYRDSAGFSPISIWLGVQPVCPYSAREWRG
jgi:hypothetical protein